MRAIHRTVSLLAAAAIALIAGDARAYFEIEEFDEGFGAWTFSPQRIGRSSTDGWLTISNDGERSVKASPTGTRYTYYWKLIREVDLSQAQDPELDLKFHFKGHAYEYFRVQIGPQGASRNAEFTTLEERTEATADPEELLLDLSDWVGEVVTIRLLLKKPYNVVENKIGLYVHRVGVVTSVDGDPAPPEPELLSVGAFNVQVFGRTKMTKPDVPDVLVDTVARYDLLAFQEIRDSSGEAIVELHDLVELDHPGEYELALSDRLGRTSSKEQYAFFYRPEKLTLLDAYHFDDGVEPDEDLFQREPYIAHFANADGDFDFAVAVIHTSPSDAVAEVDLLRLVVDDIATQLGESDVIVLGDFNAGCTYVEPEDLAAMELWTDPGFSWWIPNEADTTVGQTVCPYDRIVTAGEVSPLVQADTAQVFLFDQAFVLGEDLAKLVSDHYPVELVLDLNAR